LPVVAPVVAKYDSVMLHGLIYIGRQDTTDCTYAPPEDEKLTMGILNSLCDCQVTSTRSCRPYGSAELISNHTSRSKCYPQIHKGVLELGRVGPWIKSCYESEALSLAVGPAGA
jgi:hypothetical protein